VSEEHRQDVPDQGWCSLRLRFDQRELLLLRGAERVRGVALAHNARPEVLRTALKLAKAGHKLGRTTPGASVSLEQSEVSLLLEALRFATEEVQWSASARANGEPDARRRDAVLVAFPELVERGGWRSFGLTRELQALTARLASALSG
jgi:transposase-like protein